MSAWFPLGVHVGNSAVEQTVEILFFDRISPQITIPPFEGNMFLLPVTSIGGLIFELICPAHGYE
jgi:hypothetical protein